MSLISFGASPRGFAADRAAFVSDLRKLYDAIDRLGLREQFLASSTQEAVAKISKSLILAVRTVGYERVMKLLAAFNKLAQKHWRYMERAERDRAEMDAVMKAIAARFKDVQIRGRKEKAAGLVPAGKLAKTKGPVVMGGIGPLLALAAAGLGIFFVARSFTQGGQVASGQALLDFFLRVSMKTAQRAEYDAAARLAESMALPKTAIAIRADAGLPSDEMWPGTAISVRAYVEAYIKRMNPSLSQLPGTVLSDPTQAAKDAVLLYATKQARYRLSKPAGSPAPSGTEKAAAVAGASYLRLPFTAVALTSSTSGHTNWPTTEFWPGSNQNVSAFMTSYLTQLGLGGSGLLVPSFAGDPMYKEISGRIVDVDGCGEEDMLGVTSTGIEEIVGAAKAAKARRQGKAPAPRRRPPNAPFPPMTAQKVKRVPGYKPRVEIVDMPEMQIYSGPVDPRMSKLDPSTQLLLQMIRKDNPVRTTSAPVQRQRSIYPGSRGRYSY